MRLVSLIALILVGFTGTANSQELILPESGPNSAGNSGLIIPRSGIIVPGSFNEIENFQKDFCNEATTGAAGVEDSQVLKLCFGHVQFQASVKMRAVVFVMASGKRELYVERDLTGVELLNPRFEIVGPVNASAMGQSEIGQVLVGIGHDGEVEGMVVKTLRHGVVSAERRSN